MSRGRPRTSTQQRRLRIGLAAPSEYGFGRDIIRGASQACLIHGAWFLWFDPVHRWFPDPAQYRLDGLVATVADLKFAAALRDYNIPVINVSGRLRNAGFPRVVPDNVAVGRLAAEHLLEQRPRSLTTLTFAGVDFAEGRSAGFAQAVAATGETCAEYPVANVSRRGLTAYARDAAKPMALFTLSDTHAVSVMRELREANIRVPEDVLVVGVDDDDILCMSTDPPLTSVNCDYQRIGATAIDLLVAWLTTGQRPPDDTVLPPRGLIVRSSSTAISTRDPLVNDALRLIREEVTLRINVKMLALRLGVSRRTLELRFLAAMDSSPAAEIVRAQVQRARQLLADTNLPLDRVAEASGLGYQRQLRSVFKRHVGMSPASYRRRYRGEH